MVRLEASQTRLRNRSAVPTPVYLLAAGPRMTELAGEVADGAVLLVGLHPAAVAEARRRLEVGARRAGRCLDGFRTIFIVPIAMDDSAAQAQRWVQRSFRTPRWHSPIPPSRSGSSYPQRRAAARTCRRAS